MPGCVQIRFRLHPIEGGEHAEGKCGFVSRVEQHRHERIGSLKDELRGRQRPGGNQTAMNHRQGIPTGIRKACLNVVPKHSEEDNVLVLGQPKKGLGREGAERIVCEHLTEKCPSRPKSILEGRRLCGDGKPNSSTSRPHSPQPSFGVRRQGYFGVRVHRLHRKLSPFPERRKIKPPDLSILREGEIVHRVLAVSRLAGVQVFIVGEVSSPENSGAGQGKSLPNHPPPHDCLNAMRRKDFLSVCVHPERHRFGSRVRSTQRMSQKGPRPTLVGGPLSSHRRTEHHCSDYRNVC